MFEVARLLSKTIVVAMSFLAYGPVSFAGVPVLVIGNSNYKHLPTIKNATQDAKMINSVFLRHGFDSILLLDATYTQILKSLAVLRVRAGDAERVVVYYAGHGAQVFGESYIIPVDAGPSGEEISRLAIPLRVLVRAIADKPRQKIIVFDACRDNPSISALQANKPDSPSKMPAGLFVLYSAQAGAAAYDGAGPVSPFARSFVMSSTQQGQDIEEIGRKIRLDVLRSTQGVQIPWSQSSLVRSIVFWPKLGATE